MLKNLTILSKKKILLSQDFSHTFKDITFLNRFLKDLRSEMINRRTFDQLASIDVLSIKIMCIQLKSEDQLFISLTFDDSLDPRNVEPKFEALVEIIQKNKKNTKKLKTETMKICKELMNSLPPKISIIGDTGVGKTSICNLLIGNEPINKYQPTDTMDTFEIDLFGHKTTLWDFSGAINEKMMRKFLRGSDAVMIVFDAARKIPKQYKYYTELVKSEVPHAELLIIATKIDTENAFNEEDLKQIMPSKFLALSANSGEKKEILKIQAAKLLEIISKEIDYKEPDYIIQQQ